ncbi:aminoglycoside phosphotransferase family protein [Candidatus Woesearchaeota archaeon]|nr:aminoglycoside phosphotransferase family protein [Candidatus Woesearchaeota archaeon]
MDINKAKKIIEKETKAEIRLLEDATKGWDHKVYIAQTNKGCFVLRVPIKDRNKIKIQAWVCNKWHKLGVPVPKPIILRRNYLVEECIPGIDMEHIKLTNMQRKTLMQKLCSYLKKMHTIKTKKYGPLAKPGIGKYDSWKDFTDTLAVDCLRKCRRQGKLSRIKAEQIKKEYDQFKEYLLNFKDSRLVHSDLCADNIMINKGKLSGIIDAADALSGDPLFDIAVMYYDTADKNIIRNISKTYGKIDFKIVRVYAIIACLWVLAYHKSRKDILKEKKKLTRLLSTA